LINKIKSLENFLTYRKTKVQNEIDAINKKNQQNEIYSSYTDDVISYDEYNNSIEGSADDYYVYLDEYEKIKD
jgi:hypothetical protein